MVFRDSPSWLTHVDVMSIELHDDSSFGDASSVFFRAIERHGFTVSEQGEQLVCINPRSRSARHDAATR